MPGNSRLFSGKVVLITGGSSGIGLALAKEFASLKANVWIAGRREEKLYSARLDIREATGQTCGFLPVDISESAQAERLVVEVTKRAGLPDLLINSAGVTRPGYIQELGLDVFREMMEVNYFGTVNMIKAVMPGMLDRHSGHIINISSGAGYIGLFGYSAYAASKYAVRGFSDVLRSEMKPHGIRVSVVFPPDTDTPQLADELPFKPPETRALTGTARVLSARAVARSIIQGVFRGRYIILPGYDNWLLYHLASLLGNGVYPIIDLIVANARRKKEKS